MLQVTQIVRFLLEALSAVFVFKFVVNLGFCGLDLMQTATFNAPVSIYPEGLAFIPPFLPGSASAIPAMVHLSVIIDQDLARSLTRPAASEVQ